MKALIFLVLAVALGYVSYQYLYPPLAESLGLTKPEVVEEVVAVVEPEPEPEPEPMPEPPKPVEKPAMEEKPKPAMPEIPMVEEPKPEPKKPSADEFVPPEYPPIEVVVDNWAKIPPSAFPRAIKVKKQFEFKIKVGSGTASSIFEPGQQVYAISQSGPQLTVSPSETSPARGQIAMEETDLQQVLTDVYEKWKVWRTETLRRAWEFRKNAANRAVAGGGKAVKGDEKPEKNSDGAYPILLASMAAGEVTEIKPDNIKSYGDALRENIDDQEYWTILVTYETVTMFGKFEAEAQARIKNNKVQKWVYTGSGEVVP
ncbi:MAG: hypothetical protein KDK99_19085 [Verrucomicrobiales bacterium]|nr:hypothetical protein [Verrucomicrobiales bacterium]